MAVSIKMAELMADTEREKDFMSDTGCSRTQAHIQSGLRTINIEKLAVAELLDRIDENFAQACELILACKGRVVVTGVGKSGHIAKKIAATLASTGTPAFYVHPGEASHGDLGMITRDDICIAISSSGNAKEILTLLPTLARLAIPVITLTGNPSSPLASSAAVILDIAVETEACPLNLAPTASTTVTLVMGDALAVALLEARGFTAEDFAMSHPGGLLGRRLLIRVSDLMHTGASVPIVSSSTSLLDALTEISHKGVGMTTVVNEAGHLLGIFTDGDLRRALDRGCDIQTVKMDSVMTKSPSTIKQSVLAVEALTAMENRRITALIVEEERKPIGVIHMHDLLQAGLV